MQPQTKRKVNRINFSLHFSYRRLSFVIASTLFIWGILYNVSNAQPGRTETLTKLTLRQCVELALERNLQLEQLRNNAKIAEANLNQSKLSYIPNANFTLDFRQSYGTTFNQLLFQRINQTTDVSNPFLSLNTDIFRGLAKYYTLKQNFHTLEASAYTIERNVNTIITNVLASYLLILFDHGNIKITRERIKALDSQLERTEKLFAAGMTTQVELSSLKSQIATENVTLINQENQLERDKLSLLILMQAHNDGQEYDFEIIDANTLVIDNVPLPALETVEQYAVENMPEMKEQRAQVKAAEYRTKVAQSSLYPSVSFTTGVSSNFVHVHNLTFQGITIPQDGYFKQIDQNLSRFIYFSLNVPIFNGFSARRNVQTTRLNELNTRLAQQNEVNQLIRNVQQAYLDAKLAQSKYQAVQKQVAALEESYQFAEKRFNSGVLNFYTFFETLNNKSRAEAELLQAKYDYFFKRKILDVYQGVQPEF